MGRAVTPGRKREMDLDAEGVPERVLVTLHLPLDIRVCADVMTAVARTYPSVIIGENGQIIGRERPA